MVLIVLMKQDDDTDQEIGDDLIQLTGDCNLLSNISNDDLDHQQEVPLLCPICRETSL